MKYKILFLNVLISMFFTACVMHPTFTDEEKKIADPLNNVTYYSDAFKKLNNMIKKTKHPVYRFQVKTIENLTSSKDILPIDSKSFIITPLILHMSGLKLLAYEPIFNRYETQTTGHVYFPSIKTNLPQLVIGGGITQFDKGVFSKSSNFDVDLEYDQGGSDTQADLRGDRDRSTSISHIALDLNVFRYKDRVYLPGVATKNKIEIKRTRKKNRLGFFLNGSGIGESKYITLQQSKDEALRILTEYSLLQLLGRLYNVPYWESVTPALKADPLMVATPKVKVKVKGKEKSKSKEKAISTPISKKNKEARIEQILPSYGFSNVNSDGKISKEEEKMLLEIVKKYKFTTNKVFSEKFYKELIANVPQKKGV